MEITFSHWRFGHFLFTLSPWRMWSSLKKPRNFYK